MNALEALYILIVKQFAQIKYFVLPTSRKLGLFFDNLCLKLGVTGYFWHVIALISNCQGGYPPSLAI